MKYKYGEKLNSTQFFTSLPSFHSILVGSMLRWWRACDFRKIDEKNDRKFVLICGNSHSYFWRWKNSSNVGCNSLLAKSPRTFSYSVAWMKATFSALHKFRDSDAVFFRFLPLWSYNLFSLQFSNWNLFRFRILSCENSHFRWRFFIVSWSTVAISAHSIIPPNGLIKIFSPPYTKSDRSC